MQTDINVLALAYIGDAIYELHIRQFLISKGITKVNDLQKEAIKYVSAKGQSEILKNLLEDNFFNEEEINIIMRTRNHKGNRHPKNTDILTYKHASGFEAVLGHLYLKKDTERIDEIIRKIISN